MNSVRLLRAGVIIQKCSLVLTCALGADYIHLQTSHIMLTQINKCAFIKTQNESYLKVKNGLLHYFSPKKTNPGGVFLGSHPQGCHVGAFGFGTCWLIQALPDLPAFCSDSPRSTNTLPSGSGTFTLALETLAVNGHCQREAQTDERCQFSDDASPGKQEGTNINQQLPWTRHCLGAFLPLVSKDMQLPENS